MNNISKNIRVIRKRVGINNLALFLKVENDTISKIENSEIQPSVSMIEKLTTLLGISIEQVELSMENPKLGWLTANKIGVAEMEAIYAVNKIAQNSVFMSKLNLIPLL